MNDKNLKKGEHTRFTSGEQAARAGRKGGKKSQQKRREKKNIAACLKLILDSEVRDDDTRDMMRERFGLDDGDMTYSALSSIALLQRAIKGDVSAIKLMLDVTTQQETERGIDRVAEIMARLDEEARDAQP